MMWTEDEMWFEAWPSASAIGGRGEGKGEGVDGDAAGDAAAAAPTPSPTPAASSYTAAASKQRGLLNSWGYSHGADDEVRWSSHEARVSSQTRMFDSSMYQVARFFARGAVLHNFYMWFGGNNYEQTAGGDVTTRYADSAPLFSDGLRNEPPFSHLTKLHLLLHSLSGLLSGSAPQLGNSTNCTVPGHHPATKSSVVSFRYRATTSNSGDLRGGNDDIVFVENDNATTGYTVVCWGRQYTLGPSTIQVANTTSGRVLWSSDSGASTAPPMKVTVGSTAGVGVRIYTPVDDAPFVWKAFQEPLELAMSPMGSDGVAPAPVVMRGMAATSTVVSSPLPLEQLNLTNDETGYCVYQTNFTMAELLGLGHAATSTGVLLVLTGRTNNAYTVAIDGHVVAMLQHHKSATLGSVSLNATVQLDVFSHLTDPATTTTTTIPLGLYQQHLHQQHTLSVLSSSLGLRNDDIFATSREAKGISQLLLGDLNLTSRHWDQRAGLVGEKLIADISKLQPSHTIANKMMVWLQSTFTLVRALNGTNTVYVFDANGLGRGHIYVNGFDIGMYWPLVPRSDSGVAAGQRYGAHFSSEIYTRGWHWFPRLLA
jgi:hypothetical protein